MNQIWLNAVRASARAAVAPWWLAGGAPEPVAVYQPIGAASLAASYVNLANPGTFDAAPGVAPTWASGTGWAFNGTSQFLTTGVTFSGNQTYSVLLRFSNAVFVGNFRRLLGAVQNYEIMLSPQFLSNFRGYTHGAQRTPSGTNAAGVMGFAGRQPYFDGVTDGNPIAETIGVDSDPVFIGGRNNAGVAQTFFQANVQAIAIYSSTLDASQVAAVSAAMAAL